MAVAETINGIQKNKNARIFFCNDMDSGLKGIIIYTIVMKSTVHKKLRTHVNTNDLCIE